LRDGHRKVLVVADRTRDQCEGKAGVVFSADVGKKTRRLEKNICEHLGGEGKACQLAEGIHLKKEFRGPERRGWWSHLRGE